jgi:restriction endonuclease Mrr
VDGSDATLSELPAAEFVNLFELSPSQLRRLVRLLLMMMGYSPAIGDYSDLRFDLVVSDSRAAEPHDVAVDVRLHRYRTPNSALRQLLDSMNAATIRHGMIVTTGALSPEASTLVENENRMEVVDGRRLVLLLRQYLEINARVGEYS